MLPAFKGDKTTVLSDFCILVSNKGARVVKGFFVGGFVTIFSEKGERVVKDFSVTGFVTILSKIDIIISYKTCKR